MLDKYDFNGFDHPSLNYKKPKSLQIFNASVALLFSTIVVVGLWSALWFGVATLTKKEISGWIATQGAYGNIISYENVSLSGYPSRIIVRYDKPQLKTTKPYNILWGIEHLTINVKPWAPWKGLATVDGKTNITLSSVSADYNFNGKIEKFDLMVNPGQFLFDSINMKIIKPDLVGSITKFGATVGETVSFSADEINIKAKTNPWAQSKDAVITMAVNAKNMVLPWLDNMPISNRIDFADIAFKVSGSLAPNGNGNVVTMLTDWRDGGGKVFVDNLTVHGHPLGFSGGGNIFLDKNLQPAGRMSAKISGLLPTINRFRDLGLIRDSDAVVAKMTLAALSQKTSDGKSFLNLGLEIKDRVVYLGPIGIGELPPMNWQ